MFSMIIVDPCPPFYPWGMIIGACIKQLAKKKKEKEAEKKPSEKAAK